jgi:ATP-binding cassette subfamily B protein/subfamily B ATP-binding cassette protein MsbA
MANFRRVVALALRERLNIFAAIFCSLMVALLWGANFGLVKPIIEVVFSGRTPHAWVDWQIERTSA